MDRLKGIILSFILLGVLVIGCLLAWFYPFPQTDEYVSSLPTSFAIHEPNRFETQVKHECSAFSSAYVMRHFGHYEEGLALYETMDLKIPQLGYVLPKGILNYFNEQTDYNIEMYVGNYENLKSRLLLGVPVIVLVGDGFNWQHYMTLVGYDEDVVYFFDSLEAGDSNGDEPGNRTMDEAYFLSMWDNKMPVFNQLYFVVSE